MTKTLGLLMPQVFAALAPVSAGTGLSIDYSQEQVTPLPTMLIHGTADTTIPYYKGIMGKGITSSFEYAKDLYKSFNRCTGSPQITQIGNITRERYTLHENNCAQDLDLISVQGGGHKWYGWQAQTIWGSSNPTQKKADALQPMHGSQWAPLLPMLKGFFFQRSACTFWYYCATGKARGTSKTALAAGRTFPSAKKAKRRQLQQARS